MSTSTPTRATQPPLPEQHPQHPVTPSHLTWLSSQVVEWQREGLIAPWQARALVTRYRPTRSLSLARLLLALGAVFVGFGLIWLVAANLDQLTPLTRFVVVAALWAGTTVGAELLAQRRAHGGPVPSPAVHSARLLAALLFGATVFQAAQSLQVPAYEPRLVGVWALGALLHGYAVRAAAPVVVGVVAGFTWTVWSAAYDEPTTLGILLTICSFGIAAVSVATLHDVVGSGRTSTAGDHGSRPDLAEPWRVAGVVLLLGSLFAAAQPFLPADAVTWSPRLVVTVAVAALLALAAALATLRGPGGSRDLWLFGEPLGAVATTALTMVLVLWEAGGDAADVGVVDWAHAAVAVLGYLVVSTAVAALGVLRERTELTVIALVALVLFTTEQSFAVFAQIIDGAWLFLVMGLVLAGTGWLADRGRRRLARSLRETPDADTAAPTTRPQQGDAR